MKIICFNCKKGADTLVFEDRGEWVAIPKCWEHSLSPERKSMLYALIDILSPLVRVRKCLICERKHEGKGYCRMHYDRMKRRYGSYRNVPRLS